MIASGSESGGAATRLHGSPDDIVTLTEVGGSLVGLLAGPFPGEPG